MQPANKFNGIEVGEQLSMPCNVTSWLRQNRFPIKSNRIERLLIFSAGEFEYCGGGIHSGGDSLDQQCEGEGGVL